MPSLPREHTSELWKNLNWKDGKLSFTKAKNKPLIVSEAPKEAGLYRITWVRGDEDWCDLRKEYPVKATQKIPDAIVDFSEMLLPVCLSIGRTTNIHNRIRQHFGTNENNNRILQRLRQFTHWKDEEIFERAIKDFAVEWAEVLDWIERCLLESYGKAVERPIFDLDAEH